MQQKKTAFRAAVSLVLVFGTITTLCIAARANSIREVAAQMKTDLSFPLALVRSELGVWGNRSDLSPLSALAVRQAPILSQYADPLPLPSAKKEMENHAEPTKAHDETAPQIVETTTVRDNGVPSQTLRPSASRDGNLWGNVYCNNSSSRKIESGWFDGTFAATYNETAAPQVLIVHTHATESYTLPSDEHYEETDNRRTLDNNYNMIAIGEEIAQTLSSYGIGVIHDCTLHDYPSYSGSYNRSLETIEKAKQRYPSIAFVLDVHRDAVSDSRGTPYKLLCEENPNAAQMEFVIGTDGGGAKHDLWRENLKLACAVQQTISEQYPTLMRPIVLRNSRYNQHATLGSLLLEVGAAGNSFEEARNAARIFAEGFAKTIKK